MTKIAAVLAVGGVVLVFSTASGRGNPHKPKPTPRPTATPTPLSTTLYGASVLFALDHPDRDTDAAVSAGLNTIRIVNFLDESGSDPYDAWRWSRVDTLIAAAKARGLRVILDLSTYRNQRRNQGLDPYGDWSAFLSFVGDRYRAETAIAYYALAGEPEVSEASELVAFYGRATTQLHAADADTPVSSGGLLQYGWNSGIDWQAIFRAVDVPAVHVYSTKDEAAVQTLASYAQSLGKPFVIEEFGFNQLEGDAQRAADFDRVYALASSVNAGVAFWNLGPQIGDSYDVNTQTPLTWAVVAR